MATQINRVNRLLRANEQGQDHGAYDPSLYGAPSPPQTEVGLQLAFFLEISKGPKMAPFFGPGLQAAAGP